MLFRAAAQFRMSKLLKIPTCPHLGQAIGPLKVTCYESGGQVKFTAVNACGIYGRCLPNFRGQLPKAMRDFEGRVYRVCVQCGEHAQIKTPADATANRGQPPTGKP